MNSPPPSPPDPVRAPRLLTIGQLASRTGVASATLRAWEQRLGFPVPVRTSGGQRRYRAGDVDAVRRVLEERARGLTLAAAVRTAAREEQAGPPSLYAALRAAHPELDPIRVSLRVVQGLTWSTEDECLAHATRPLVFGCFQTEQSYRIAGTRWRELARTASTAVALSDFAESDLHSAPLRVALPSTSPMLNEWSLVCLDPGLSVVLAAWELPPTAPRAHRRFEVVLSLEPDVARDAALICASLCADLGVPGLDARVAERGADLVEDPRRTASLLRRFATYADD